MEQEQAQAAGAGYEKTASMDAILEQCLKQYGIKVFVSDRQLSSCMAGGTGTKKLTSSLMMVIVGLRRQMFKYWSNIFGMLGVALIATAFFRPDDWQLGAISGAYFIGMGAWFYGLSLPVKGGRK